MSENIASQLRKGILQGFLLILLDKEPNYGYGIMKKMSEYGLGDVPKGTIYPLLTNMTTKGLIKYQIQASDGLRTRKYYYITEAGKAEKQVFSREWLGINRSMNSILGEENE